jgi:hypothetical protein
MICARLSGIRKALGLITLAVLAVAAPLGAKADAVISVGTPITNQADVPMYLTDESYPFVPFVMVSLGADEFLLPVDITGATNLQSWQFTLLFNNTVVNEVDPGDGSVGIYGGEFTPSDLNTVSFILSGFPNNFPVPPLPTGPTTGTVDTVAGFYPSLLLSNGPSGDGVLAYILFEVLPNQDISGAGFSLQNAGITELQVPEPGTLALLVCMLVLFAGQVCLRRGRRA